jgi:hypothetical protein
MTMDQIDSDLSEPWQRLRWARHQWQTRIGITPSAQAAAESLGMNPHTYRTYEGPPDRSRFANLSHQRAIQFGRKYGVSWRWLLTGEGSPKDVDMTEVQARVMSAMLSATVEKQHAVADIVERMLKAM